MSAPLRDDREGGRTLRRVFGQIGVNGPRGDAALPSAAGYVGLLGARKRLPERLAPLRAAGFSEARLQQLHAPIGLDIGGKAPWEVALSVIGEITALRHARLAEEPRKATPKRATA